MTSALVWLLVINSYAGGAGRELPILPPHQFATAEDCQRVGNALRRADGVVPQCIQVRVIR